MDLILHSLTVAGAAPDLLMPVGMKRTGFPFHPVKGTRNKAVGKHEHAQESIQSICGLVGD